MHPKRKKYSILRLEKPQTTRLANTSLPVSHVRLSKKPPQMRLLQLKQ
jgi:hypothetical protein